MACVIVFLILFYTSLLLPYSDSLSAKIFRCDNGRYINDNVFCDNVYNCADASDEKRGCNPYECLRGQFYCDDKCVDITTRCNLQRDCVDNSDELNCGDQINVNNCSISDGKFLCYDRLRCLDFEYTCDGFCNCFDCSDENSNCSTEIDNVLLKKCPHYYFPTPDGPKCMCDPSNDQEFTNFCKKIKNCTDEQNICQQRCSQYQNKFQCSCYDDFMEIPGTNGFKCRSNLFYGNSLIYSTASQIKALNLTTNEVFVVKNNVECAVLTAAHNDVFYTTLDGGSKSIFKTSIVSGKTYKIVELESPINSIAVDYITNNVYFTTDQSLSVCSKDGRICTQLKCCNVTYVALAPEFGLMFYTMKSNFQAERFIMKSNLDGSNESLLVDGTFRFLVPLAVEEASKKLYWLEMADRAIYSVSFAGSYKEIKSIKYSYQESVTSFTALESKLYFTKNRDNEIYTVENIEKLIKSIEREISLISPSSPLLVPYSYIKAFKYTPEITLSETSTSRILDKNLTFTIRNVYAYNSILQNVKKAKNPCETASCSGLCLLRSTFSMNDLDYICVCNDFDPTNDQHHWCNNTLAQTLDSNSIPKKEAVSTDGHSQSNISTILLAISMLVLTVLILLIAYAAFRKWNCYGYHDTLRDFMFKSNERMDIYNGDDL